MIRCGAVGCGALRYDADPIEAAIFSKRKIEIGPAPPHLPLLSFKAESVASLKNNMPSFHSLFSIHSVRGPPFVARSS